MAVLAYSNLDIRGPLRPDDDCRTRWRPTPTRTPRGRQRGDAFVHSAIAVRPVRRRNGRGRPRGARVVATPAAEPRAHRPVNAARRRTRVAEGDSLRTIVTDASRHRADGARRSGFSHRGARGR